MTAGDAGLLFAAALAAGALNSVAGGGSFLSFPALLFTGVPAIPANATNTVALWPGSVASMRAYRGQFTGARRLALPLGAASLAGGLLGAWLLLRTPERTFLAVLPWLLLAATLLFTFGGPAIRRLRARGAAGSPRWAGTAGSIAAQFVIATYGGYFGGGIGILMLAALAVAGMEDIHAMNAIKTLLASLINGIAVVAFVVAGVVAWPQALLMIVAATLGGYGGAWYAQRIDPRIVRGFVTLTGAAMTAYFFWRA